MTLNNKAVESFKDLENQKIDVSNETLKSTMIKVFREYPNTLFKQGDFAKKLNKRTQHINHILKDLLTAKLILREGSRKQYYYKLNVSK